MTKNKGLGVFCLVIYPLAWHLVPNPQKKKKKKKYIIYINNLIPLEWLNLSIGSFKVNCKKTVADIIRAKNN